ncbi:unnamed protein product [Urochloa decumbens]|uniref:F-box domain-containing protein n=1 Tax=Urochloa decumbens TaxID=240449 RepID=A0ABC9GHM8_9POAL
MDNGADRMSALSDDLLRRILCFVTSKEAASTSVLSRRWRLLWRSSGAINLAVRLPGYQPHSTVKRPGTSIISCQQAFDGAAEAALAAAEAPVTRLTVQLDGDTASINQFLHRDSDDDANMLDAILSHPKAAHVDYLRVALVGHTSDGGHFPDYLLESAGIYKLVSLPSSETLRVLDLTRCDLVPPSPAFPQLTTLRLRLCSFQLKGLQALLDAAPGLATVHLESIFFTLPPPPSGYSQYHLRFPAVTTLVLASCDREAEDRHVANNWVLEIDAPRLRSLTYKDHLRRFRLRSPAPGLARVDLHFLRHDDAHQRYGCRGEDDDDTDKETTRVLFWQFLHNFASARALKLKVSNDLKDIAANGEARRAKLLCAFPNVERLELEGSHRPRSKTAAVAIANLLHCCPVLRDLTLRLSAVPPYSLNRPEYARPFLARKDRSDYSKSVDRFTRRSSETTNAIMEDSSSGVRCHDDVPDIPGLRGRSFACLQGSLRRVSLQFRLNESSSSCLGRRLVKFFAENAVVLEEMCVDSGNRRLYEHINFNVSTKACFEHRNLADGSCQFSRIPNVLDSSADHARSTTGFTVLPLQRR